MIEMKKEDGTYSKTMLWNALVIPLTGLFGVAVTMLPAIEAIVAPPVFVGIALLIKAVDVYLRQITTQPMQERDR